MQTTSLSSVTSASTICSATAQTNKATLSLGSVHADVAELQQLLGQHIEHPASLSNSVFDTITDYVVRCFQHKMFLTQDGIVGPNTWLALYAGAPVNMPVLQLGSRHPAVVILQEALSAVGFGVPTGDDLFDSENVQRSVALFQKTHGLTVDTIVGPKTWLALSETRLEDPTVASTIRGFEINNDYKLQTEKITSLAVEPFLQGRGSERKIATASSDATVRLWQSSGSPINPVYCGDRDSVSSVAFHPTKSQLISGTFNGTVRISDYAANTLTAFPAGGGSVRALAIEPTGQYIATLNGDGALRLFNFESRLICEVMRPPGSGDHMQSVAISKQGQLAAASKSFGARLWENPLNPSARVKNISTSHTATAVCFNPNGSKLAVARDSTVQIYSNQLHGLATAHCPALVTSIAFSQSGRYIAMGCLDRNVYIFDLRANNSIGEIVFTLEGHAAPISAVAFSHTPEFTFHSADDSGRLITWNLIKGLSNPSA